MRIEPEQSKQKSKAAADQSSDARRPAPVEPQGENGAQHAAAIHWKGRDEIEQDEDDVHAGEASDRAIGRIADVRHDARIDGAAECEKEGEYNYRQGAIGMSEMPGVSVFTREGGNIFHTYSAYARGLDMVNVAYHYMDLVPKGRDENEMGGMAWLHRRDEYTD